MKGKGIFCWFGFVMPIEQQLYMIKEHGFDNVMLWWGDEFCELNGSKEKVLETAGKTGLNVENAHLPYDNTELLWSDNLSADDVLGYYLNLVEGAANYGIQTLVFHPSYYGCKHGPSMPGLRRIEDIIRLAEKKGIVIAVENLKTNEHMHYMLKHIESPALKICYDSGHEHCGEYYDDILNLYGKKLAALHLHDNNGLSDAHLLPGKGTINWPVVMSKIKNTGYSGSLTLEAAEDYLNPAYKNAEDFLKSAFLTASYLEDLMLSF